MSSSRKKVLYLTVGGLSFAGALGAWTYFKRNAYDDDDVKPEKVATKVKKSDLRLKQVQIIFRHGARTPIHLIPNVEEVCFSCICYAILLIMFGVFFWYIIFTSSFSSSSLNKKKVNPREVETGSVRNLLNFYWQKNKKN